MQRMGVAACQPGNLQQNIHHLWMDQTVKNMAPIPALFHQTSLTKGHQVLRNTGLAHPQGCFDMAYTGILHADHQQDLYPCRLADERQEF